jgi:hypothetical protein
MTTFTHSRYLSIDVEFQSCICFFYLSLDDLVAVIFSNYLLLHFDYILNWDS